MSRQLSELEQYCQLIELAGPKVVSLPTAVTRSARSPLARSPLARDLQNTAAEDSGIQVHEDRMCAVSAQRLYQLRCECGRSWFELECKKIVHCPACQRLGLVSE